MLSRSFTKGKQSVVVVSLQSIAIKHQSQNQLQIAQTIASNRAKKLASNAATLSQTCGSPFDNIVVKTS
jgi:hypothetical protein